MGFVIKCYLLQETVLAYLIHTPKKDLFFLTCVYICIYTQETTLLLFHDHSLSC